MLLGIVQIVRQLLRKVDVFGNVLDYNYNNYIGNRSRGQGGIICPPEQVWWGAQGELLISMFGKLQICLLSDVVNCVLLLQGGTAAMMNC